MNALRMYSTRSFSRFILGGAFSSLLAFGAHGAGTELATEPFALSSNITALPNIMFVLDDSGSMQYDYLPDWAGPRMQLAAPTVENTPAYQFYNSAFNGIAYNPATRYRPPVMYTNTGSLDTTTYPSQTGQSVASGGDGSATALLPNWRAVKVDGYGVQSTATANLEGAAFFYATVAGEYCNANNLRSCIVASAPSGAYTFPAQLRWCTTPALAADTTANAGTSCQASNIEPATGITAYEAARMARQRTSTITVSTNGTVTGLTVSGVQILSASASGATSSAVATSIAANINACTYGAIGGCGTLGYSAKSAANVVTIYAPTATTVTPVVTGGSTSVAAFSGGNVPGATLFTVITPTVTSYPYPGSATKASGRVDCVGTTCTYAEEMANYANWYAYYRTRMQMMKSSSSLAFSTVDEKFRVGYFSINNGSGTDFLNVSAFDGAQRNAWYTKFFAAVPYGTTPLRTGLATAGRYYAGKLSTLNTVSVIDPMQYSCQQNYTILSTDGYWNDTVNPVQVDGTTAIGQQDGNDPRPYYDGATQTRTSSQTLRTDEQVGYNSKLVEKMTQQIQTTTRQIDQAVTTTTAYDWERQVSQLQRREKPLQQTRFNLTKTTRPLIETPLVLTENTIRYSRTSQSLSSISNLLRERTTAVRVRYDRVRQTSTKLQRKVTNITVTETPLIRSTFRLSQTTRKLQKRSDVSYNGGDAWSWTGWSDVTGGGATCVQGVVSPPSNSGGVLTRNVECQYVIASAASNLDTCTAVAESSGPTYTQQAPVQCAYQSAVVENPVVGSFNDAVAKTTSGNNYVKSISYAYGSPGASSSGQTSCTVQNQTSAPWVGPARTCAWDSSATTTVDVTSGTCTTNVPGSATSPKTECGYNGTVTVTDNLDTCTNASGSSGPTYSILQKVSCSRMGYTSRTTVASCTELLSGASSSNPGSGNNTLWETRVDCSQDGSTTNSNNLSTCTVDTGVVGNVFTPRILCSYSGTTTTGTNLASCTVGTPSSGAATGNVWNAYNTCTWASATTTGTNLNSCVPSGSGSGSTAGTVYSGPLVACANQAATSQVVTTCTPSAPNPPVPLYSSPIVTCQTVADTANATVVTTCTPSATVACAYGTATNATNQATCKPQSQAPVGGTYTGPAVDCAYANAGTTTQTSCTTVAQVADGTGTFPGPAYDCAYGSFGSWSNVSSGTCDWRNDSVASPYVGPSRECRYGTSANTKVGTCTVVPGSSGTNTGDSWSVLAQTACVANPPDDVALVTTTVNNCVNGTVNTNPSTGVNVSATTVCAWRAGVVANAPACAPSGGELPVGTFATDVACSITNLGETYVAVAPSCTETGGIFDASGKLVKCRETDLTTYTVEYPVGPVPVASCTAGTNSGTKVQTTCATTTMPLSKPAEPVETCIATGAGAPHYVTTSCTPVNSTATVMGCTPQVASSPLWQTVTCAWDGSGTSNTLADVAAYYYKTDLRTVALNNCIGAVISPAVVGNNLCTAADAMNNVPTTATDTNAAQHMTTFTLGLGASGYMRYSSTYLSDTSGDFHTVKGVSPYLPANGISANPSSGICSWQASGLCNWPVPVSGEQTTIDDLWHAGVNGHGAYFSATDPVTLADSISSTLAQVASQSSVAAAATVSNPVLTPGDSYIFSGTYKTVEWTGDVMRFTLDPFSGVPAATADWSAQSKLDANVARSIYTFDSSVATTKLRAFTSANFATNAYFNKPHITGLTQFQCLYPDICLTVTDQDATHASGGNLVNYLRGDRTNEGAATNNSKYYRERTHILGDIVNAQVTYVTTPFYSYADPGYEAFKTGSTSRQAMAYVAANDGMLHAIAAKGSAATETAVLDAANTYAAAVLDPSSAAKATAAASAAAAATAALASDTVIGQEKWAFIPTMVLPELYRLADKKYQDKHRYYVDATPVVGDVCVSSCTSAVSAVWKTILVGGLGRGGRGYYALDISDPANPKALWEFTDANLGYTYGTPQIAKMSDGTWVVLLTTGYNNIPNDDGVAGDGVGRLYVLNANTGAQITGVSPLSTGVGTTTVPSGLVKITAPVISPVSDATVVAVYGGDLLGNLWRFDINDQVGATGYEAQLFAVLKDGSGKRQPITTRPIVTLAQKKYLVLVGTGQFLATSDATVTDQQSIYGLVDHRADSTVAATAIYDNPGGAPRLASAGVNTNGFVMQKLTEENCPSGAPIYICTGTEKVMTSSNVQVDFNVHNGWFVDFINSSERANLDPALALGTLVFNTNAPSSAACDLGGKSYQYWLDYKSGGAIQSPGSLGIAGKKISNALVNAPTLFTTDSGLRVGTQEPCVGSECFKIQEPPVSAEASLTRRTSWRELIRE